MKRQLTFWLFSLLCICAFAQEADTIRININSRGGQIPIMIESVTTSQWQVELVNPSDWLSVEKKDSTCFILNLPPNNTDDSRQELIRMFSAEKEQVMLVIQYKYDLAYDNTEQTLWIPFGFANPTLKAFVVGDAANWARAVRHGDDSIMLSLDQNTGRENRSLTISVTDNDKEVFSFTVLQLSDPLPLSQTEYTVGDREMDLPLCIGIPDEVHFELPQWIQLKSTVQKGDSCHYVFSVQTNMNDTARTDTIRIATMDGKAHSIIPVFQYKCSQYNSKSLEDIGDIPEGYFTDASCSALNKGITKRKIKKIKQPFFRELAMHLLEGDYEEFRIQNYRAWADPDKQAQENGTRPFSKLDNPTGIGVIEGEPLIVFVDGKNVPDSLQLLVQYLAPQHLGDQFGGPTYTLRKGMNVIKPMKSGLCYLIYRSETPETAEPVTVHFAGGYVNGYFDVTRDVRSDGTMRWEELLSRAGNKYFDIVSPHIHFTLRVADYRQYVPDPRPLLAAYDTLFTLEQEFQGFRKYGRMSKNRLYLHTSYAGGALYAAYYHIGLSIEMLGGLLNVDKLKTTDCWGPAHELGHELQIDPAMNWTAMIEVTNNILSMEIQRHWGNPSRLHVIESATNEYKDTYERAMNVAFVQQKPFTYLTDWFDQLVSFWQLRLYLMDVCGKTEFYKDVYEASIRAGHEKELTSGEWQLEFIYNSCVSADIDLRPFFSKWGWLTPTERVYDDYYGKDSILVKAEDIEKLNRRIEDLNLPLPQHAAEYITDNNLPLYQHLKPVTDGVATINTKAGIVSVTGAEGAVGFEVYCDGKLMRVSHCSSFGLPGVEGLDMTKVTVMAVAPDGERVECRKFNLNTVDNR